MTKLACSRCNSVDDLRQEISTMVNPNLISSDNTELIESFSDNWEFVDYFYCLNCEDTTEAKEYGDYTNGII